MNYRNSIVQIHFISQKRRNVMEKKVNPDEIVTKKVKSKADAPEQAAGVGESNMANGAMPGAPTKYPFAPEPEQAEDAE